MASRELRVELTGAVPPLGAETGTSLRPIADGERAVTQRADDAGAGSRNGMVIIPQV